MPQHPCSVTGIATSEAIADVKVPVVAGEDAPSATEIQGEPAAQENDTEAVVIVKEDRAGADSSASQALVPFGRAKARANSSTQWKKILQPFEGKPLEESLAEVKARVAQADVEVEEATAREAAQAVQADLARQELDKLTAQVVEAVAKETHAAEKVRDLRRKTRQAAEATQSQRQLLREKQDSLAMLEVLAANQARMNELMEMRKAALERAQEARRFVAEQRRLDRQAMKDATQQALQPFAKKGAKRAAAPVLEVEPEPQRPRHETSAKEQVLDDGNGGEPVGSLETTPLQTADIHER